MKNIFIVVFVLFASSSFSMYKHSGGAVAVDYEASDQAIWEGRLAGVQMYLYLDRSGSMRAEDKATNPDRKIIKDCGYKSKSDKWTRMDTMKVLISYFANPMLRHDEDNKIPAYLFSDETEKKIITDADNFILQLDSIHPKGQTELEEALRQGFQEQENPTEENRALHVVFTDGEPSSTRRQQGKSSQDEILKAAREGVFEVIKDEIVDKSHHLKDKMSVLFIQIGDSKGASEFLEYLDDCEDIGRCVDTKTATDVFECIKKNGSVAKVLENGIFEDVGGVEK